MLLNDTAIRERSMRGPCPLTYTNDWQPMIVPFSEGCTDGVISYGLTSAGYDLRLAAGVWIFKNSFGEVVNPKRFNEEGYKDRLFDVNWSESVIKLPSRGYALGTSYEYLRIPLHLKGRCVGKSTYARCGILINTTPLEPGWEGRLTIEISNLNPCEAEIYVMEGIAQLEFEMLCAPPEKHYGNKHKGGVGKYQYQTEVTPPRMT